MKLPAYLLFALVALMMTACGPTPPSIDEVKERIIGAYCAEDGNYRLELKDSTYFNRKVVMGPLGQGPNRESCNGLYKLVLEDNQWILQFQKDNRPKTIFESCEKSFVVWNPEKGYVYGTEKSITMVDLIDGKTLTKGACDD